MHDLFEIHTWGHHRPARGRVRGPNQRMSDPRRLKRPLVVLICIEETRNPSSQAGG